MSRSVETPWKPATIATLPAVERLADAVAADLDDLRLAVVGVGDDARPASPVNETACDARGRRPPWRASAIEMRSPAVSSMSISRGVRVARRRRGRAGPGRRWSCPSPRRRRTTSLPARRGRDDVVGDGPDAIGVGDRGAAELLDDERHSPSAGPGLPSSPSRPSACVELARDDPDLVRVALGDLREHLQVLVGEQLRVGVALVDRPEDRVDRLRLALGLQDLRLALALGAQDRALLLALGGEDLRLLDALRREDRRALVAVGAHLLLHRVLDRGRRVDRLQLDAVDADAPLAGRLVEHAAQLAVDLVAGGQRLLERHAADHVAQRRHGELLDRLDVVRRSRRSPPSGR